MADNARGVHVSPGVYSREIDLTYAVKSLGITTLGVAGETLRGPAFQPMHIEDWRQFTDVFGGTSTEKFKGSQYPKYELPYIAKSYLTESKQLEVVRVLGLSGYKAGPAWVVTAKLNGTDNPMVVAVLRARGHYEKYHKFDLSIESCECPIESYDKLIYEVGEIKRKNGDCEAAGYNDILKLKPYTPLYGSGSDCDGYGINSGTASKGDGTVSRVSSTNLGKFTIYGLKGYQDTKPDPRASRTWANAIENDYKEGNEYKAGYFEYPVSLNPFDKDYILKVLGTDPQNGDAPIYVESLYDVALSQSIAEGKVEGISSGLTFYNVYDPADYSGLKPINGILEIQESGLQRKHVGLRYLADEHVATPNEFANDAYYFAHPYDYATNTPLKVSDLFTVQVASATNIASFVPKADFTTYFANEYLTVGFLKGAQLNANTRYKLESGLTKEDIENESVIIRIGNSLIGQIFTVANYIDNQGKRNYFYRYYPEYTVKKWAEEQQLTTEQKIVTDSTESATATVYTWKTDIIPILDKIISPSDNTYNLNFAYCVNSTRNDTAKSTKMVAVKNLFDGLYYRLTDSNNAKVIDYVNCDLNNYSSPFRYASTPWIVSNLKGDYNHIELNKLFRFHTISDGNNANYEVKVSIENIRPDEGVFDVVVRNINDTDEYVIPLEKFSKCNLTPGDKNFIGFRIGTIDGIYESKSKFITVEVAEGTAVENSVPAGFLGYPMAHYGGLQIADNSKKAVDAPSLKYNLNYDIDVKNKRQYFGLSTKVGVDIDAFTYKGKAAYIDNPEMLTQGFHLDSRLDPKNYIDKQGPSITVDGESGYKFDAVSIGSRTSTLTEIPAIGSETLMQGSIYEYVNLRKFTVYFYGGFDGWDTYRDQRTNTDDFKMSKYLGTLDTNSGEGYSFNRIDDPEAIGLNQGGITSDWYAYLAAYRQFANPEAVDINVFATPGIDYVNNKTLVEEVIDMIEEERADSIYVVTTPDKPSGASDYVDEMYTPEDAVFNLEDSDINSNYTCTYYPWVKYLDQDNNQYIYLPATKDAVRNFAQTDNTTYPWFAPAGLDRGDVNCVRAHYITKLADEDTLYEGRINPVKTFAQDGVKLWGQKNLQVAESQLNRIAIRRLLLRMRKLIAIACRSLIFEPNDPTTKNSFLSIVTPIMDNIRANRGISDYKIEVDDSIEARDRRELPAKIFFKAYNALEYITLDFILTPEGISFEDI